MNQPNTGHKAYNRATHTVSKTRQVVMLYDGMIRFLQQAQEAIEKKDYETRYNKLVRVSDVIIGLQACLDFEAGGDSARVLYDFYAMIERRIYALHRSNSMDECKALVADLKKMRDVWDQIDRNGQGDAVGEAAKLADAGSDPVAVSV